MKKILILTFLTIAAFSACKKDKKITPKKAISDPLVEVLWRTTLEEKQYFDENNKSLFTEDLSPGSHYTFADFKLKLTDLAGNISNGSYSIAQNNGKTFITIMINGKTEVYELTSITNKVMIWTQEKLNQPYIKDGVSHIAYKQVTTIKFHCPCAE